MPKTSQDSTNSVERSFLGIFVGLALYAGGIWKRDILVADVEALENMDASEIHARRLNAEEVLIPKNCDALTKITARSDSCAVRGSEVLLPPSLFSAPLDKRFVPRKNG